METIKTQDMPPPGGYKPIPYVRIPAKQLLGGYSIFAGFAAITTGSLYLYYLNYKNIVKHEIEMRSARMALHPMLLAERDREYLKQLRRNRDAEAELMRDVPGWEVGTWYGEKVYKLPPPDALIEPSLHEFYAHADEKTWFERMNWRLWT